MFDSRETSSRHTSLAASAATLVLAIACCTPAFATNIENLHCLESTKVTLEVKLEQLTAISVKHDASIVILDQDATSESADNNSANSLLAPLAVAAIRDAFDQESTPQKTAPEPEDIQPSIAAPAAPMAGTEPRVNEKKQDSKDTDSVSSMNTKLPGISDDDFQRYKKRMYRRDI